MMQRNNLQEYFRRGNAPNHSLLAEVNCKLVGADQHPGPPNGHGPDRRGRHHWCAARQSLCRTGGERPHPATLDKRNATGLDTCNSEEFASLPPSRIVPKLADQGRYLASESRFNRMPHSTDGQQHHRGRASLRSGANRLPLQGQRALRGLDLGHHLVAGAGSGHVLLTLSDGGHLQPENRGPGSA